MVILTIILAVALAVSITSVLLLRANLRQVCETMREIGKGKTNGQLRLATPQPELEELLVEVNALVAAKRRGDSAHKRQEGELRQQIANITHDLRTPLTSILGYLQLIRQTEETSEERAEYFRVVEDRARALQALVDGLYDLSKIETGGYQVQCEPIRVDRIIRELAAAFYYEFLEGDMQPVLDIPEGLSPVCADEEAVRRVYTNLFQNALRHGKGSLRITAREQGNRIVTSFANLAPELTGEDAEHLFDRFYTADKMRTGRGSGLGLAIVRSLVEQMDGAVSAGLDSGWLTITVSWPAV